MATTSPPSPPPAPPAPGARAASACPIADHRRRRARDRRADRRLPRVRRLGRRDVPADLRGSRPARRGNQVQVGGVPVGSVTKSNSPTTTKRSSRSTSTPRSSPLHRHGARWRAFALERRQPLHRALARAQQRPRLPAGATLPASVTSEVTDLDSSSTRSTRRRARACSSSSRAPPNSTSARAAVSANRPNCSQLPDLDRALLLGADPRTAGAHELPRGNRQGRDDDRRAQGTARRPHRKPEHDLRGDRRRAERARAGLKELPRTLRQGNRRSPNSRRRSPLSKRSSKHPGLRPSR